MAKYIVKTYFEYVGTIEVEADSPEEALKIGQTANLDKPSSEYEFVDYTNSEVWDSEDRNILLTTE